MVLPAFQMALNHADQSDVESKRGGYWLDAKTDEYDLINHYLQLCCQSGSDFGVPNNVEIWKIEHADVQSRFERRASNMLKLTSWTLADDLRPDNNLHDLCKRGFLLENGGLEFSTGKINIKKLAAGESPTKTLVYSEIAVGRSYVTDEDPVDAVIPPGYDSFYIPPQSMDRNRDGEFSLQEYQAAAHFDGRNPRLGTVT